MHDIQIPLLLTFLAGISTVLGSFVVFFLKDFKKSFLSFFLGVSAGTMIYLSFIELLPHAIESVGFQSANIAFFIGILVNRFNRYDHSPSLHELLFKKGNKLQQVNDFRFHGCHWNCYS